MFDIQEELKKLPNKPGVYIMKDKKDTIIYVGKAINLKNRVRQYFQASSSAQNPKVKNMAPNIKSFEYIVTDNEVEALILECNLIKKHTPKYNVMLKDDKTYPYLKLTVNEPFPRLFITRVHKKDKAKYFGPFTSGYALKEILDVVYKIWPLRKCSKKLPIEGKKERPCLNYHIGQCKAPCNDLISKEEYEKMIEEIISFLNGKSGFILKKMEQQMLDYSSNLEFEKAAEIRDKINSIKRLDERQKITGAPGEDQDIIAFARAHNEALVQIFFVRNGKMTGREHFMMYGVDTLTRAEVTTEFIKQFYSETTFIPKEIIVETDVLEKDILISWLSKVKEQNVIITTPQKGEKLKLVQLAAKNAILELEHFGEQLKREQQKTIGALKEIQNALGISNTIERIEAYDISNIQGFESVGSMVVFENGKSKSSDYRKFRIKSVLGPDDYASMEELITRRFLRYKKEKEQSDNLTAKFLKLPDIIFMDGGKGQVHSAEKVLRDLNINIPVCGMIKDDRHRTRGLIFNNEEIFLPISSEGFKLITRIQDEVHRFAIEYHRKLREKKQIKSVLDDIPGIGNTRRKALLRHFGDVNKIRDASIEELAAIDSMNTKAAEEVYKFFR